MECPLVQIVSPSNFPILLIYLIHPTCSAKNVQKIIPSDHKELLRGLVKFKEGLESVVGYDHIIVPPVYKQVRWKFDNF